MELDEALELANYLPISFSASTDGEYTSFLWEAFQVNYDGGKYQFAFLAYHMLMMCFVYFKIWQVRESFPDDFEKGLIGFAREDLLRDARPFTFSKVNEGTVIRLFRLIGCDDSQIGAYRKLVGDRNNAAHANGNIYFGTQPDVDARIREVLRAVEEIQSHSQSAINQCYEKFLLQNHNPGEWEYPDAEDQIREVLIHGNYMSQKDIEFCGGFDISALGEDNRAAVEALHNVLCEVYGSA